jgi:hypothetical protein
MDCGDPAVQCHALSRKILTERRTERTDDGFIGQLFGIAFVLLSFAGWCQDLNTCFNEGLYGFIIAGRGAAHMAANFAKPLAGVPRRSFKAIARATADIARRLMRGGELHQEAGAS